MPKYKVVNPEAIDHFLYDLADDDARLFALLRECLRRPLLREQAALHRTTPWLARMPWRLGPEQPAADGTLYQFSAAKVAHNPRVRHAVLAVKRWLAEALQARRAAADEAERRRCLERLRNVVCLDHALSLVEQDGRRAAVRGVVSAPPPPQADTEVALQLEGGWQWRRLLTPAALRQEGAMMRHCLGCGRYDSNVVGGIYRYYSLRDAAGRARVTMEVCGGFVTQMQGRANSTPAQRYEACIKAIIDAKGWMVLGGPRRPRGRISSQSDCK